MLLFFPTFSPLKSIMFEKEVSEIFSFQIGAPSSNKTALKKGKWSPEEDEKLVAYIKRYGIWNWNEMPKAAGLLRSGKSCRLRWINYLRPNIKHGNFTKEEEETILSYHQIMGNRWSAIAAKLPGRTDNEIKNYWHAHLKKQCKESDKSSSESSEKPALITLDFFKKESVKVEKQ